jgi:hypothetical protein
MCFFDQTVLVVPQPGRDLRLEFSQGDLERAGQNDGHKNGAGAARGQIGTQIGRIERICTDRTFDRGSMQVLIVRVIRALCLAACSAAVSLRQESRSG